MHNPAAVPRSGRMALLFLVGTVVFAAVCCQAPLYYSNQNQYFVHGLASASLGQLKDDWLANTRDPTPIFSYLVEVTTRHLHPWMFHVYYALLQGAYAAALFGLFAWLTGKELTLRRWPVFVALLVILHAALLRWASYRLLGQDYPWFFQAGVAGQYVLGAMFQPSTFGVLLIVAVGLFVWDRPFLAAALAALTATLHSTYLLSAGLLTLGFVAALWREGRTGLAVRVGACALVLVLPITLFVFFAFRPTSTEAFLEAQSILVHFRIPHHSRPDLWLDPVAGLQLAWIVLALVLVRRTRLFAVLAVPFALAALLTLAQVRTGNDTLALLFPWRIAAVLVPLATAVILSRLVMVPRRSLDGVPARTVSLLVIAALAAGGVWICVTRQGYLTIAEDVPLMEFVRESRKAGYLYFLPVKVPNLVGRTRGSLSTDFKPLPEKKTDERIIPVDLQQFRLTAGVPIFVDFKSIPYRDTDVIEWRARIRLTQEVQLHLEKGELPQSLLEELRRRGVTHLVQLAQQPEVLGVELRKLREWPDYRVYWLGN